MAIPKKISTVVGKEEKKKAMKLSPTHHPPYAMMICEAISSLKERNGSSQQAISKFIQDKYSKQLPPNFKKSISLQLKKSVLSEEIIKVKNTFKITVAATNTNPEKKKKAEKPTKENSDFSKEKIGKMKLLSQVKTPEALKKKKKPRSPENNCASERVVKKTKCLSQVKPPEVLEKKKVSTPLKMKEKKTTSASRANSSRAAQRRARN